MADFWLLRIVSLAHAIPLYLFTSIHSQQCKYCEVHLDFILFNFSFLVSFCFFTVFVANCNCVPLPALSTSTATLECVLMRFSYVDVLLSLLPPKHYKRILNKASSFCLYMIPLSMWRSCPLVLGLLLESDFPRTENPGVFWENNSFLSARLSACMFVHFHLLLPVHASIEWRNFEFLLRLLLVFYRVLLTNVYKIAVDGRTLFKDSIPFSVVEYYHKENFRILAVP